MLRCLRYRFNWALILALCQLCCVLAYTRCPASRLQAPMVFKRRLFMTEGSSWEDDKGRPKTQEDPESYKINPTLQSTSTSPFASLPLLSAALADRKDGYFESSMDLKASTKVLPMAMLGKSDAATQQERPVPLTTATATANNLLRLAAVTYAVTSGLLWMLYHFEWFQSWRYLWPLLGGVYVFNSYKTLSNFSGNDARDKQPIPSAFPPPISDATTNGTSVLSSTAFLTTTVLAGLTGIGLIIGGAYDAFMPVWMTGPNVFTAAGIGQDSAMILLGLTTLSAVRECRHYPPASHIRSGGSSDNNGLVWRYALLLSQLYILSDSAIDDVFSGITSTVASF